MNNNVVLVMDNPVKWRTLVREQGGDPDRLGSGDAVPYYVEEGRSNERFSEEERRAIVSTNPSPKLILVKQECKTGEIIYVPIRDDADGITSFFENVRFKVHDLVSHFLTLLGGNDIKVNTVHKRDEQDSEEQGSKTSVKGENPVAGGSAQCSVDSKKKSGAKKAEGIETITERTVADFKAAHEHLDRYPWMKGCFSILLEEVENGRIYGKHCRKFSQEVSKEISEGFHLGIEVAARYQLINGSVKHELSKQLRKAVHDVEEWEYSMNLPLPKSP